MSARLAPLRRKTIGGLIAVFVLLAYLGGWLRSPRPWPEATGWQRIPADLRPLLSDPWQRTSLAQDPPQLEWLGHAGFKMRWKGTELLVDPNLSDRCTVVHRVLENPLDAASLDGASWVLLSHPHPDHLDLPTLRALPSVRRIVVPQGTREYLQGLREPGVEVKELEPWESLVAGQLEVIAVPADHHGSRWHPLRSSKLAIGFVVRSTDGAIYIAGDTGVKNDFEAVRDRYHPEVAILPIGAFAPSFPIGRVHLSPEQAVDVARTLGVKSVVPSHFGTFRLSLDAPSTALPRFARAAHAAGVRWAMPVVGRSTWAEGGST